MNHCSFHDSGQDWRYGRTGALSIKLSINTIYLSVLVQGIDNNTNLILILFVILIY